MNRSPLRKYRPHLESLFGPLSQEADSEIRSILAEVDEVLLEIARYFLHDSAHCENIGLELTWCESGQVEICGYVSASAHGFVEFGLELWPSWFSGERSSTLSWEIETTVWADCQHTEDHGGMDSVYENRVRVGSAIEAARALLNASHELRRLAIDFPLEHWQALASDGGRDPAS